MENAELEKKLIEKPLLPPAAPPAPARTFTLIDPRDHFIGVCLAKIVEHQVANGKWEHDVAASQAVRFADAVMRCRATVSRPTVSGAGRPFVPAVVASPVDTQEGGAVPGVSPEILPVQPPAPVQAPKPPPAAAPIPGTVPATAVPATSIPAPIAERIGVQPPLAEVG